MRLDVYLTEKLGISSRQKAQALIIRGDVFLDTTAITKPGYSLKEKDFEKIHIKKEDPYVGFGAYKLLKAIDDFDLGDSIHGHIILDIGASTGGFTQVLLEKGSLTVYAIDVGENQLDYRLREDNRVISYEKTDARKLDNDYFTKGIPTFFVVDVSFISLRHIFPTLKRLKIPKGVVLIKPQFEVGREIKHFEGIVKKEEDQQKAILKVKEYARESGFEMTKVTLSPSQNNKKNKEFLGLVVIKEKPSSL